VIRCSGTPSLEDTAQWGIRNNNINTTCNECACAPLSAALDRRGQERLIHRRDHNGQALSYVYAEDKRTGARPLTRDEARRIAANVAKLSELLGKPAK
jgi:hypothetical protein